MKTKIEFKVSEKALVYAVARLPVVPEMLSSDDCLRAVDDMLEKFGTSWSEQVTSHQRYNLKLAWDAVRSVIPLTARSIDTLE